MLKKLKTEIVVVGAGPGGYAAAFYAADQGKKVTLVESNELGGVCLNRGCIPSKALLNIAHTIEEAAESKERGLSFGDPKIDLKKIAKWKNGIISKLSGGIETLAKARGVDVIQGRGYFEDSQLLRVETKKGQQMISFDKAIIAVGSRPALPAAFDLGNPRIMTSTEALEMEDIPKKLLIVGGGYIGLELGTVYAAMGSEITLVEALPQILTGADRDLVRPVEAYAKSKFKEVRTSQKVIKMATKGKSIKVTFESDKGPVDELYDKVLISVGRTPNSHNLGLDNTQVVLDEKGYIGVNDQLQTADPSIYAIGDIAGGILLAHKASKEARIAVESILGDHVAFEDLVIPAVVFTHPEVSWAGLTETEAKEKKLKVKVAKFPWSASGRAMTFDKTNGMTKLILEPDTNRVLGVGIVGHGAGELIAEGTLAIEMGATAEDLAEVIHAHPTLSETVMESAEAFFGHATHLVPPKK
tara:strand:+ start:414 stop:1826 length:1413 start_codon:yes stop_codon:yes gene_type:complete